MLLQLKKPTCTITPALYVTISRSLERSQKRADPVKGGTKGKIIPLQAILANFELILSMTILEIQTGTTSPPDEHQTCEAHDS